jgi:hypothetical protein
LEDQCDVPSKFYKGIIDLLHAIVYPKGELIEWHNRDCLYGQCLNYGIQKLFLCPIKLTSLGCNLIESKWFSLEEELDQKMERLWRN